MNWNEIHSWPNAKASRQIKGPVHRWHVQQAGTGDQILLLHGAGGSTHSWRDVFTDLSADHDVIALDLPGHGFTQLGARHRSGLAHMVEDIAGLCEQEHWHPTAIVAHSAGCAIALELCQRLMSPRGHAPKVIGINAALGEFKGIAGLLFPAMAKVMAAMPFAAALFSGTSANPARIASLIAATGSTLDVDGLALYQRLVADRDHVDGTLLMMAQWNLKPLLQNLASVPAGTVLIVGSNDKTVPPETSHTAAAHMTGAKVVELSGLGHLAHEEKPAELAGLIRDCLAY